MGNKNKTKKQPRSSVSSSIKSSKEEEPVDDNDIRNVSEIIEPAVAHPLNQTNKMNLSIPLEDLKELLDLKNTSVFQIQQLLQVFKRNGQVHFVCLIQRVSNCWLDYFADVSNVVVINRFFLLARFNTR